jgi:hypothetical protein
MACPLPFEIGIEYSKAMKGARHWVFARHGPPDRPATARAKP